MTRLQRATLQALQDLGSLAPSLCCVLGNPDMATDGLRQLGFLGDFVTINIESPAMRQAEAILLVTQADNIEYCMSLCLALDSNPTVPTIIVVLLVLRDEAESEPLACLAISMAEAREELFVAGANDVLCLAEGEALAPHRVSESVHRAELEARRAIQKVREEVGDIQRMAVKELQAAHHGFLMRLPENCLDSVPCRDTKLQEVCGDDGQVRGVQGYLFRDHLGRGTFSEVYLADHPTLPTCAVKRIAKSSIRNARIMLALDTEMCLMQHLPSHPNIVKAQQVLQGEHNFYMIMDYGGKLSLHCYTKQVLEQTSSTSLPGYLVGSFSTQELAGVGHLHRFMVCHRDLKPCNWLVGDDGRTLKLTEIGLAAIVCRRDQLLKQSCGSLPFCAPEVLGSGADGLDSPGYCGFAADVWSLGLNLLELAHGPYSIEAYLGWVPRRPDNKQQVMKDLERLEGFWGDVAVDVAYLQAIVARAVVLRPSARCAVEEIEAAHRQSWPMLDMTPLAPAGPKSASRHRVLALAQGKSAAEANAATSVALIPDTRAAVRVPAGRAGVSAIEEEEDEGASAGGDALLLLGNGT